MARLHAGRIALALGASVSLQLATAPAVISPALAQEAVLAQATPTGNEIVNGVRGVTLESIYDAGQPKDGVFEGYTQPSDGTRISDGFFIREGSPLLITFDWRVDSTPRAGDYFTYKLPEVVSYGEPKFLKMTSSWGTHYADATLTADGLLTVTFNENVRWSGVNRGTITMKPSVRHEAIQNVEQVEIALPGNDPVIVNFVPKPYAYEDDKEVSASGSISGTDVTWDVEIPAANRVMTNSLVTLTPQDANWSFDVEKLQPGAVIGGYTVVSVEAGELVLRADRVEAGTPVSLAKIPGIISGELGDASVGLNVRVGGDQAEVAGTTEVDAVVAEPTETSTEETEEPTETEESSEPTSTSSVEEPTESSSDESTSVEEPTVTPDEPTEEETSTSEEETTVSSEPTESSEEPTETETAPSTTVEEPTEEPSVTPITSTPPVNPVEPTEPTTEPSEAESSEPEAPSSPAEPSEEETTSTEVVPSTPVEPSEEETSSTEAESSEPEEPSSPAEPTEEETTSPVQTSEPVEPTPTTTVAPSSTIPSAEPTRPTNTGRPTQPQETTPAPVTEVETTVVPTTVEQTTEVTSTSGAESTTVAPVTTSTVVDTSTTVTTTKTEVEDISGTPVTSTEVTEEVVPTKTTVPVTSQTTIVTTVPTEIVVTSTGTVTSEVPSTVTSTVESSEPEAETESPSEGPPGITDETGVDRSPTSPTVVVYSTPSETSTETPTADPSTPVTTEVEPTNFSTTTTTPPERPRPTTGGGTSREPEVPGRAPDVFIGPDAPNNAQDNDTESATDEDAAEQNNQANPARPRVAIGGAAGAGAQAGLPIQRDLERALGRDNDSDSSDDDSDRGNTDSRQAEQMPEGERHELRAAEDTSSMIPLTDIVLNGLAMLIILAGIGALISVRKG